MSSDFCTKVIVGVQAKDVYEEKEIETVVTKFDENTGNSYQKIITVCEAYFVGRKVAEYKKNVPTEAYYYRWCKQYSRDFSWLLGLEMHSPSFSVKDTVGESVIGICIASVDKDEPILLLPDTTAKLIEVKQKLVTLGCDFLDPQIFLQWLVL